MAKKEKHQEYTDKKGLETTISSWKVKEEGWFYCLSGMHLGLYYETDDIGPYDTREEAIQAAKDHADFEQEDFDSGW